ncbi:unnamed protein product, partial [Ectocarpus sp. 12 AP-2014]
RKLVGGNRPRRIERFLGVVVVAEARGTSPRGMLSRHRELRRRRRRPTPPEHSSSSITRPPQASREGGEESKGRRPEPWAWRRGREEIARSSSSSRTKGMPAPGVPVVVVG